MKQQHRLAAVLLSYTVISVSSFFPDVIASGSPLLFCFWTECSGSRQRSNDCFGPVSIPDGMPDPGMAIARPAPARLCRAFVRTFRLPGELAAPGGLLFAVFAPLRAKRLKKDAARHAARICRVQCLSIGSLCHLPSLRVSIRCAALPLMSCAHCSGVALQSYIRASRPDGMGCGKICFARC